jgi:SAM-dependent methyltransferase
MKTPLDRKSSTEEIRRRFDADVERFSNMETGQQATVDAPLAMELITRAALAVTHPIRSVLDIGCGAGNNTLTLLQFVNPLDCDLVEGVRLHRPRGLAATGGLSTGPPAPGRFFRSRPAAQEFLLCCVRWKKRLSLTCCRSGKIVLKSTGVRQKFLEYL